MNSKKTKEFSGRANDGYIIERFETYVDVKEMLEKYYDRSTTLAKCKGCPGFALTWTCPEFDFDPADFWKQYSQFHFIVDRVFTNGTSSFEEARERLYSEKPFYDEEMRSLEKETPGATALAAQECVKCKKCARLAGIGCIHPEVMRYALESTGMLAVNLVKDKFGFDVLWSDGTSIPEYYLLVGGVLEK
ncbi:MAG TPA: DUF2284 domain-containing protein [Anaerovoracaceae bacterium]|nr:DUF2284 domain-containing protein [Anaerovoracaceae bacterium]